MDSHQSEALLAVLVEREAQDLKWGEPPADRSPDRWMTILTEEVGEVAMAINDDQPVEHLKLELAQSAAVCVSWLEHLERWA